MSLEDDGTTISYLGQDVWQLECFVPLRTLASIIFDVRLQVLSLEFELYERVLLSKRVRVLLELSFLYYYPQV